MNWSEVKKDMKKRETAWGEEKKDESTEGWGSKRMKKRARTMLGEEDDVDDKDYHIGRKYDEDDSHPREVASGGSVDGEDEDDEDDDKGSDGDEGDNLEYTSTIKEPAPGKGDGLESLSPDEKARFLAADKRRRDDSRILLAAFTRLVSLKAELQNWQRKMDEAQNTYDNIKKVSAQNAASDADDLLLEPSPWNDHYKQLLRFFEREGHSNFKRTITPSDVADIGVRGEGDIRPILVDLPPEKVKEEGGARRIQDPAA